MTSVEKTPRILAHAHKGQTELGPTITVTHRPAQRTVTWAGDAASQASEHSEGGFFGCRYQGSNPGWWAQPTTATPLSYRSVCEQAQFHRLWQNHNLERDVQLIASVVYRRKHNYGKAFPFFLYTSFFI